MSSTNHPESWIESLHPTKSFPSLLPIQNGKTIFHELYIEILLFGPRFRPHSDASHGPKGDAAVKRWNSEDRPSWSAVKVCPGRHPLDR